MARTSRKTRFAGANTSFAITAPPVVAKLGTRLFPASHFFRSAVLSTESGIAFTESLYAFAIATASGGALVACVGAIKAREARVTSADARILSAAGSMRAAIIWTSDKLVASLTIPARKALTPAVDTRPVSITAKLAGVRCKLTRIPFVASIAFALGV